ncbi:MAG TPA: hypothetical protein VFF73_29155 [Planctomycetota bacterium]|nr:hypothetical protein [Planctomycetota bacterium]
MSPRPCLRCGDFVGPGDEAVAGLALCVKCADAGIEPTARIVFPAVIVKARLKAMLAMFLLMGLAFAAGPVLVGGGFGFAVGALLMLAAELGYIVIFFSRIMHAGHAAWREDLRVKLALPAEGPFSFVLYFPRRPRIWNLTVPFDAAFVAEGEGGLVFLGERVRMVIPYASLARVGTRRVVFNPPRTTVELELREKTPRYFAFIEKNTFRANRDLAVACAERISARLVGST